MSAPDESMNKTPPKVPPPPAGFPMKLFKKCKSATFQIDGATYTIGKLTCSIKVLVFCNRNYLVQRQPNQKITNLNYVNVCYV